MALKRKGEEDAKESGGICSSALRRMVVVVRRGGGSQGRPLYFYLKRHAGDGERGREESNIVEQSKP